MINKNNTIRKFLCRIGIHRWVFIRGNVNKYYECKKCGKRKVEESIYMYSPLDRKWLEYTDKKRTTQ